MAVHPGPLPRESGSLAANFRNIGLRTVAALPTAALTRHFELKAN